MESAGDWAHRKTGAEFWPGGARAAADARRLSGLKAGVPATFEEALTRHEAMVYNLTRGLTDNDGDAQGALQDAFLSVFKSIKSMRTGPDLSARLRRAAIKASLRRAGRRGAVKPADLKACLPAFDATGHRVAVAPDWHPLVDRLLEDRGKAGIVRRWIAALPPAERAVLVLREQEGLNSKEVASILGWGEAAVRSSLHRARLYVRERAKRHIYSGR